MLRTGSNAIFFRLENIIKHHAFRCAGISVSLGRDFYGISNRPANLHTMFYEDCTVVLDPIVKLYAASVGPSFVLIDDNTRPHRVSIVDEFLESEGMEHMEWPAYSPDLNPIQNFWDVLDRAICRRSKPPATPRFSESAHIRNGDC